MWPRGEVVEHTHSADEAVVTQLGFEPTASAFFVGLAAVLAVAVVVAVRRRAGSPGAPSLLLLAAGAGWWSLTYALELSSPTLAGTLFFGRLAYLGVVVVPLAWFTFALTYTGHGSLLTRRRLLALATPPAATVGLAWTTLSTGLIWRAYRLVSNPGLAVQTLAVDYGPAFWVWTAYAYALLLAGAVLLVLSIERARLFRVQTATLLVAVAAPWVGNLAFLSGLSPLDLTPVGFTVSGLALAGGFYRYALLDVSPVTGGVARAELVENLSEAVVAVDEGGRIVDLNPSAERVLDTTLDDAVGASLDDVAPELASLVERVSGGGDGDTDGDGAGTYVVSSPRRSYEARVSPLRAERTGGALVTLRDVTERRQREREVAVLNRVLRHDLRNDVAVIENYVTLLEREPGNEEHVAGLARRAAEMRDLVETVRQVESHLDASGPRLSTLNVARVVRERTAALADANPDATVETDLPADAWVRAMDLIGSAVDNLVENAVEHNDSAAPWVRVSVTHRLDGDEPVVDITVEDDGPQMTETDRAVLVGEESSLEAANGLGLWLVNWIITDSGGTVHYEPNDPRGNVVVVRLHVPDGDEYRPSTREEAEEPTVTYVDDGRSERAGSGMVGDG